MLALPYGGIVVSAGATGQALTTTMATMTGWTANGQASSGTLDGDVGVVPDYTNNRIKINTPGIYRVSGHFSGVGGGSADMLIQARFNGTIQADLSCEIGVSTARASGSFSGYLTAARPSGVGTLGTFSDPSSTGFAGAGAAPKSEYVLDLVIGTLASTVTFTPEYCNLSVERVG